MQSPADMHSPAEMRMIDPAWPPSSRLGSRARQETLFWNLTTPACPDSGRDDAGSRYADTRWHAGRVGGSVS